MIFMFKIKEETLDAKNYGSLECKICKKDRKVFWVSTEFDLKEHVEKFHGADFEKYMKT